MKVGDLVTFIRWSSPEAQIGILLSIHREDWSPGHVVIRWLIGTQTGQEKVHAYNEIEKLYYDL